MKRRIGILTAGGDCPGLNACIRGVARASYSLFDTEIVGIQDGYAGLIEGNYREMKQSDFSGILTLGGTILGTRRTPFSKMRVIEEDQVDKVKAKHKLLGPKFKAKAKDIAALIEAKDPEEARAGKITVDVDGEPVELTDEFFEVVRVTEKVSGKRVIPHVIEPSHGLDRIFYSVLEQSYDYDESEDYTVLHLKPEVAPIKVGVFPLMEKDGLDVFAMDLYEKLQTGGLASMYDGSGTIGKRYARMDEIGTPYCVTVDYESLEGDLKGTVTIRDRDSKAQKRVPAEKVGEIVRNLMCGADFEKL